MTGDADAGVVWRGPESLRHLLVPIDTITPDPANANTHPDKNLRTIRGSIAQYGQQKPIVVASTGVIAAGNGTWQVLQQPIPQPGPAGELDSARWTHVAAVVSDLTPSELVGYGIVDNRSGELAEWDLDVLSSHLGGLSQDGVDLAQLGWDDADVRAMLSEFPMEEHADDDQPQLDQRTPVECPACGVSFDPKTGEIPLDA